MQRLDIAIIGCGAAGISAAITAKARNKNILLFGAKPMSEKIIRAHGIRNYPGFPDVTGAELGAAWQAHLEAMEVPTLTRQVAQILPMGEYYALQAGEALYEARTVILATGVMQARLLPGEEALLGRGVSYCATCDAFFYRGKTVAVLAYHDEAAQEAEFLAQMCQQVLYFPLGAQLPAALPNVQVVEAKPSAILGQGRAEAVETDQGQFPVDGVFVLREAVPPDRLLPGLQLDGAHVAVDLQMRTNLPGCFACGDLAGKPYQYVKAAGQGNVAALSAVAYLAATR